MALPAYIIAALLPFCRAGFYRAACRRRGALWRGRLSRPGAQLPAYIARFYRNLAIFPGRIAARLCLTGTLATPTQGTGAARLKPLALHQGDCRSAVRLAPARPSFIPKAAARL